MNRAFDTTKFLLPPLKFRNNDQSTCPTLENNPVLKILPASSHLIKNHFAEK